MEKTKATPKPKSSKTPKYYKEQFEKIAEEKRRRIIDAALIEFSAMGYNAANINIIAKNAGISIGSMYQYFGSKEHLFLTMIDEAYKVIEDSITQIDSLEGNIYDKFEIILAYIQKYSREFRLLNQLYLEATTQGVSKISKKLSLKMESISAKYYRDLITKAIKAGLVDEKIDPEIAAFCIDNILVILQFSYSSDYYIERMKIYTGSDSHKKDAQVREKIMYFLRKALAPS